MAKRSRTTEPAPTAAQQLAALPDQWRALADTLDPYAAPAAEAYRRAADELATALQRLQDEPVTPEQAESEGVCGAEAVRARVRRGKVENVGTETRIKVRRKDLPSGRKDTAAPFGKAVLRAANSANRRRGL
jgi:hypothetical protein